MRQNLREKIESIIKETYDKISLKYGLAKIQNCSVAEMNKFYDSLYNTSMTEYGIQQIFDINCILAKDFDQKYYFTSMDYEIVKKHTSWLMKSLNFDKNVNGSNIEGQLTGKETIHKDGIEKGNNENIRQNDLDEQNGLKAAIFEATQQLLVNVLKSVNEINNYQDIYYSNSEAIYSDLKKRDIIKKYQIDELIYLSNKIKGFYSVTNNWILKEYLEDINELNLKYMRLHDVGAMNGTVESEIDEVKETGNTQNNESKEDEVNQNKENRNAEESDEIIKIKDTIFETAHQLYINVLKSVKKYDESQVYSLKTSLNSYRTLYFKKLITAIELDALLVVTQQVDNLDCETDIDYLEGLVQSLENINREYVIKKPSARKIYDLGSSLYPLLTGLSDASREAIMSPDDFNEIKRYLHIVRPIQTQLEDKLESILRHKNSALILLCGNVGDGKSHLLAYLKNEHKDWFEKIAVYNDATESLRPDLTAIETLEKELSNFDDDTFEYTTKRLVLAINIGILNNFVSAMKEKGKFNKFIEFVEESTLFHSGGYNGAEGETFQLVSFFDNPIVEITSEGAKSDFYEEVFRKIFQKTKDNPFYQAYLNDKEDSKQYHYNYKLLLNERIQGTIQNLLIRVQIQDKLIISTRALFNFIYGIIVPTDEILGKKEGYLPFLLFENRTDSVILSSLSELDPIKIQNKHIDLMNVEIYNANDYLKRVQELLNDDDAYYLLEPIFKSINNSSIGDKEVSHRQKMSSFVRMEYLIVQDNENYKDFVYEDFVEVLALTRNEKKSNKINNFINLILASVYAWNGSPKKNYLFTNNQKLTSRIAIAILVNLRFQDIYYIENLSYMVSVTLAEGSNHRSPFTLDIDLNLYYLLRKLQNGYLLKDSDKKKGVNFAEFIEGIINNTKSMQQTILLDKKYKTLYEISNNGIIYEVVKEGGNL
jgi:DNA phosphorothioation-dependent restriction protein DptF